MGHDHVHPVVIVGAGPTGLVVAIELARRGVPFRLIDRRPEPVNWSRAIFIKSRTLEILAALGVREPFYERGQIVNRVDMFANDACRASYEFDVLDTPHPHILSVAEEDTIRILTEKLASLGGAIERGVEFVSLRQDERGVRVTVRSQEHGSSEVDASLVVGADGCHSDVRKAIGVEFEGHDFTDRWGVFDCALSGWSRDRDAVCAQLTPPVVVPFPLGRELWRVYFWTGSLDGPAQPGRAGDPGGAGDDVLSRVVERLRVVSPGVELVDPQSPQFFHSTSRVARRYRVGRVFLAGDAAHVSNPIEGHGMNIGIQDAYNLGWKLAAIAAGEATDALIESYEAERRPAAEVIVASGDRSYARMLPSGAEKLQALYAFVATPDGQAYAAQAESELSLGYEQSPIVEANGAMPASSDAPPHATRIGFRVGDVTGLIRAGRPCRLHDLITGTDPTLFLLLGATPPVDVVDTLAELDAATRGMRGRLGVQIVVRSAEQPSSLPGKFLLDPAGRLHERLGADQPTLALVRPDGHLGFACTPPSPKALRAHLERMFLSA